MVKIPWARPIHTKDGKFVIAHPHEATFNGRHNAVKAKALIVLYQLPGKSLSLAELAEATGESYNYLGSRIGKWVEWGYLKRTIKMGGNKPVFGYSLAVRGKRFYLYRLPLKRRLQYLAELPHLQG